MTIHKAKGLEFENVIVLAVEEEMYWGDDGDERSAYFVAISRAKQRLWLTHCAHRDTLLEQPVEVVRGEDTAPGIPKLCAVDSLKYLEERRKILAGPRAIEKRLAPTRADVRVGDGVGQRGGDRRERRRRCLAAVVE